jgi:hypothetical protein
VEATLRRVREVLGRVRKADVSLSLLDSCVDKPWMSSGFGRGRPHSTCMHMYTHIYIFTGYRLCRRPLRDWRLGDWRTRGLEASRLGGLETCFRWISWIPGAEGLAACWQPVPPSSSSPLQTPPLSKTYSVCRLGGFEAWRAWRLRGLETWRLGWLGWLTGLLACWLAGWLAGELGMDGCSLTRSTLGEVGGYKH